MIYVAIHDHATVKDKGARVMAASGGINSIRLYTQQTLDNKTKQTTNLNITTKHSNR